RELFVRDKALRTGAIPQTETIAIDSYDKSCKRFAKSSRRIRQQMEWAPTTSSRRSTRCEAATFCECAHVRTRRALVAQQRGRTRQEGNAEKNRTDAAGRDRSGCSAQKMALMTVSGQRCRSKAG